MIFMVISPDLALMLFFRNRDFRLPALPFWPQTIPGVKWSSAKQLKRMIWHPYLVNRKRNGFALLNFLENSGLEAGIFTSGDRSA